jgi:hypothetical protein
MRSGGTLKAARRLLLHLQPDMYAGGSWLPRHQHHSCPCRGGSQVVVTAAVPPLLPAILCGMGQHQQIAALET